MKSVSVFVRPWLNAGFEYLLAENEARVSEMLGMASCDEQRSASAPLPSASVDSASRPTMRPGSVPNAAKRQYADKDKRMVSRPEADPSGYPETIPFEQWGESWQALWRRLHLPSNPLVVWTYAGLGDDLCASPDGSRRKVLASILEKLRHPRGTHVFWPHRLPQEEDASAVFWSAVEVLGPRAVVVLGSDSRDALGLPRRMRPYEQLMLWGRLVVQLHRPEMLAKDEALLRSTQVFLAGILRFCAARQAL